MASATELLFGHAAPIERSFRNKVIGFLSLNRIAVNMLALPAVVGITALAGGSFSDSRLPILFVVALLVFISGNTMNDIHDSERDKQKWPRRPLASGLISRPVATCYAITLAGTAVLLAGFFYGWLCLALWLLVLFSGYFYSHYTRDKIGHLTVIMPEALIALAIWASVSPGTILTPLPWLIVVILAAAGAALNFTSESFFFEVKAFVVRPAPLVEMALYATSVLICFFAGMAIFFYAELPWIFMLILMVVTIWALTTVRCLGKQRSPAMAKKAYMTWAAQVTILALSVMLFSWIK
jgi:heme O synthase-like polyprenyltransferase